MSRGADSELEGFLQVFSATSNEFEEVVSRLIEELDAVSRMIPFSI